MKSKKNILNYFNKFVDYYYENKENDEGNFFIIVKINYL